MCARRFLFVIVILTLLAVGGAVAMFQFGDRVLLKSATPKGPFEAAEAGTGPDYAKLDAWISHPDIVGPDPSRWQPEQEVPYDLKQNVQAFYIHPTTYLARDRWNAPLEPGGDAEFRTRLFVQSQASTFFAIGQVWAPRYRQAAYGAFLLKSEDAQKALDLAYSDVSAAFGQFIRQAPQSEPIVVAGHSQGALHLTRLLKDKVAGKPIAKRLIAAYAVGWPISTTADLSVLGLPACQSPDQTGCVLSWMTFGDPPNPDLILEQWEESIGFNGGKRRQKDILCVNPITGTRNGSDLRGVSGYLLPSADLRSAKVSYDSLGAHCANGLLIVDGDLPRMGAYVLPGNNYHVYDYALFWGAIRADAGRRLAAFTRR